jgi:hypothetical protein
VGRGDRLRVSRKIARFPLFLTSCEAFFSARRVEKIEWQVASVWKARSKEVVVVRDAAVTCARAKANAPDFT